MKNFVILVLLGIIAYLLLSSGWLQRAVQQPGGQPNLNGTPQIGVTVFFHHPGEYWVDEVRIEEL